MPPGDHFLTFMADVSSFRAAHVLQRYGLPEGRRIVPGSGGIHTLLLAAMMIPIQAAIVPVVQMVNAVNLSDNRSYSPLFHNFPPSKWREGQKNGRKCFGHP